MDTEGKARKGCGYLVNQSLFGGRCVGVDGSANQNPRKK